MHGMPDLSYHPVKSLNFDDLTNSRRDTDRWIWAFAVSHVYNLLCLLQCEPNTHLTAIWCRGVPYLHFPTALPAKFFDWWEVFQKHPEMNHNWNIFYSINDVIYDPRWSDLFDCQCNYGLYRWTLCVGPELAQQVSPALAWFVGPKLACQTTLSWLSNGKDY